MTPLGYIKLAVVAVGLGLGGGGIWAFVHFTKKAATADERIDAAEASAKAAKREAAAAMQKAEQLSKEIVTRAEMDRAIREARQNITINLDEAQREDPVARDYLGEPIPQRVRDAFLD